MEYEMANFVPYSGEENFLFINAWNEWAEGITGSRIKSGDTAIWLPSKRRWKNENIRSLCTYNGGHFVVGNNWTATLQRSPWMKLPSVMMALRIKTTTWSKAYQETSSAINFKIMIIPWPREFEQAIAWRLASDFSFRPDDVWPG